MSDILNIQENASEAEFRAHVAAGEIYISDVEMKDSQSGKQYIEGTPDQFAVGQSIVSFQKALSGTRGRGECIGYRKNIRGTITGTGKVFYNNGNRQRFYL